MRGKYKNKYNNNNGSTMVIVLVMLSFIMILATVVTSSTTLNLKMKVADRQSTKTFYTSEDAVNEIYVSMGALSTECFNAAYQDVIAEVVTENAAGSFTTDNITCNERLRLDYVHRLLNNLGLIKDSDLEGIKYEYSDYVSKKQEGTFVRDKNSAECMGVVNVLNDCIEDTHKDEEGNLTLDVESVDNIQVISKTSSANSKIFAYMININNCLVKYLTENGYYSYITFDMTLGIPDELVNITDSKKLNLDAFVKYALIGNNGIEVADSSQFKFNGNAFAGIHKGFSVASKAGVDIGAGSLLATSGDIVVSGGNISTGEGVKIWCENLKTVNDNALTGSSITINGNSNTYVKDDLEVNANNSKVDISGNYYGYGYVEVNGSERLNPSSSIIINGSNSSINLTRLNNLLVAGRAYVDYSSLASNGLGITVPEGYDTGESVSFIGNQEIYLVPASLMGGNNPVMKDAKVSVDIKENNFFGYKYLEADENGSRAIKKTINIEGDPVRDFYYLRFKNEDSAAAYIRAIFDDTEFNTLLEGKTEAVKSVYKEQREKLKNQVVLNANGINSIITLNENGNVYAKTTMLSAASSSGRINLTYVAPTGSSANNYNFKQDYDNLSARFNVLSRTLYEITDSGYMTDMLVKQMFPDLNSYSYDIYANIISDTGFKEYTKDKLGPVNYSLTGANAGFVLTAFDNANTGSGALVISNNEETLSGRNDITYSFKDYKGGVIVASGDVIVKKDFTGTIIAGGTITIEDNVTVNGLSDATDIIKTNTKYAEIFKVWNPLESGNDSGFLDVQNMTYKDMITVSNWRKRDDSKETP